MNVPSKQQETNSLRNARNHLEAFFELAVQEVRGDNAVAASIEAVVTREKVFVVAIGKAASSMCEGALEALGSRLCKALLITKYDHTAMSLQADDRFICLESAHPVPDQASLDAGSALVEFMQSVPSHGQLVVLVSGGASALVEKLPLTMNLSDLSRVNDYLLANGLDIGSMNVIRKSLSLIKGGRLALSVGNYPVVQLVISDVPGDRLEVVGSGLLVANQQALPQVFVPDWIAEFQHGVPTAPLVGDAVFDNIDSMIVASNSIARAAAARAAAAAGFEVIQPLETLNNDIDQVAAQIASTITAADARPGVYVWGGEPTVSLPENPGRGGRNQQLALQLAVEINGRDDLHVLCCGTDGTDGPTADAGGYVDGRSIERGLDNGLQAKDYLQRADTGTFLSQLGGLVTTGPTGTNVMDLVLALKTH